LWENKELRHLYHRAHFVEYLTQSEKDDEGGYVVKNLYRNVIMSILGLILLWTTIASTLSNSAITTHLVITPASPPLERLTSAQAGAFHRWSSEEIGRGLVPRVRTVQW
jgi:hypothetical protein